MTGLRRSGAMPGAGGRGVPQLGHDEGAEQSGGLLAEEPRGQRAEQDLALGQHVAHLHGGGGLADDRALTVGRMVKARTLLSTGPDCRLALGVREALVPAPEALQARPGRRACRRSCAGRRGW